MVNWKQQMTYSDHMQLSWNKRWQSSNCILFRLKSFIQSWLVIGRGTELIINRCNLLKERSNVFLLNYLVFVNKHRNLREHIIAKECAVCYFLNRKLCVVAYQFAVALVKQTLGDKYFLFFYLLPLGSRHKHHREKSRLKKLLSPCM